jgi:osmoprotectant transport system permease protein
MNDIQEMWQWLTDPANWSGINGIPVRTLEQLTISFTAFAIAATIALPVGLVLGHLGRGGFLALNIGNIGRAIPTFALLIIFASWDVVGVGTLAAILALTLFAMPPLLTNTYTAVRDVDSDAREAAVGMGLSGSQVLIRLEIPLAIRLIFTGIRTSLTQVVATATLAAVVAGGGLGRYVVDGYALQDVGMLLGGAVLVAGLTLIVEVLLAMCQHLVTPRALRRRGDGRHIELRSDLVTVS